MTEPAEPASAEAYLRRVRHALRRSPEEASAMPREQYSEALRAIARDVAALLDDQAEVIMDELVDRIESAKRAKRERK